MIRLQKLTKYFISKGSKVKTKIKNSLESIKKTGKLPKSKVKCGLLGFTTAFSIFGLTMFGPKLAAMAKDIPVSQSAPTTSNGYQIR